MNKLFPSFLTLLFVVSSTIATFAQKPDIKKYSFSDAAILTKLSDNGNWAVAGFGASELAESGRVKIVNIADGTYEFIQTDDDIKKDGRAYISDITNDGQILVGSLNNKPAYWTKSTGSWTILPISDNCDGATIVAVTPDGKYAIGNGSKGTDILFNCALMWDLSKGELINLENLPTKDMLNEELNQQRLIDITDDGRYILGQLSYSYYDNCCVWIYDRTSATYKYLGFNTSNPSKWVPIVEDIIRVDEGSFSPNGKYVVLHCWMYKGSGVAGSTAQFDGDVACMYNVETDEFTYLNGSEDMLPSHIDDEGTVYAAGPATSPIRNWSVFRNGYWYSFDQILKQAYGIDFVQTTKYDVTGSIFGMSDDAKTFIAMVDPMGDSYSLTMPTTIGPLCDNIDLLANYSASPASGMTFSTLRSIELTFDRVVEFAGSSANAASITKTDGQLVRNSSGIAVSSKSSRTIVVTFRPTTLEESQQYIVTIPAGTICIAGDKNVTNQEIKLTYNGRANTAVQVMSIYPSSGSTLAKIDNNSNPILIEFDSQLALTENASAKLEMVEENSVSKICDLNTFVDGNFLYVYPSATQYLYDGKEYKVTIAEGSVADFSGAGPNAEISLTYFGSYIREISHDSATLFSDNFNNQAQSLINFMRFEGDHLTPSESMQKWRFDKDNQPWNFSISDDESTDYCAASHSMYSPAGQSDDWMVIPQLEIPDEYVTLTFKAQSYRKAKADRLKIIVWECEENFNALGSSTIARFKEEGEVVFDQQLSPGTNEEILANDWVNYSVDLAKFSGKKIYIAFVNDNNDQSAIFVDDVVVMRQMKFFVSLSSEEAVVNQESILIKGVLTANADNETFNSATLILKDATGKEIDRIEASGFTLAKGDKYNFSFTNPLSLTKGVSNKFTIAVTMGKYSDNVNSIVKNLIFSPTKRVVLEEFTGTTCVNCPQGILAIEYLDKLYGNQFIPISIHTYQGDPFHNGQSGYSSFLGLSAAPSGIINRNKIISFPMSSNLDGDAIFSNGTTLWADIVASELEVPADVEISAKYEFNETDGTFSVPTTIKSALKITNLNLNVFIVMLEDGIIGTQANTFYGNEDPLLGEWGKGGKYGMNLVTDFSHNDVAISTWGASYNGTSGLLPQSLEAGDECIVDLSNFYLPENITNINNTKVVVMLIDGNTDKVINAICVKANEGAGVEDIVADNSHCDIATTDGNIIITGEGKISADVYNIAGMAIGSANGNDYVTIPTSYKGVAIVRATVDGNVVIKKVIL